MRIHRRERGEPRGSYGSVLCVLCVLCGFTTRAQAARPEQIAAWLEEWRLEEAEKAIADLEAARPHDGGPLYLEGNLRFLQGDYDGAAAKLRDAIAHDRTNLAWKGLRDLVEATANLTRSFAETQSEHFILRYPKGPEEILVPYATEALEATRAALAADFGWAPPGKVRVEIYADVGDLATVSTLTLKEIETSGTIALCKWNRLMIVSPRALVRGYSWLDTLNHEYTHYVVTRLSHNAVPIWLHEGIAKFEEKRWRGPAGSGLTPMMEHLLASALKRGRLITFAEMHPSMAKLPSQEDTALAFAEVYAAIENIWKKTGWAGVRKIVERMRDGASDTRAVADVMGEPFPEWEKSWKRYLLAQKYKLRPGLMPHRLKFKQGPAAARRSSKDDDEDTAELTVEKARRFARLAGLLRARGRTAAAVVEYEKAAAQLPGKEPLLQNKLGRAYLELGQLERAQSAAEAALEVYPEMPTPHVTLAEIALRKGDRTRAQEHFVAALRQNPFDPSVHCGLADLWRGQAQGDRETQACRKLVEP
ncbi:MAG TPA: tetratricopeptide repeat protein [Polyangia bacterium]|nr:tetratricopeptide repeat protein [Polyangia bacterium]